MAYRLQVGNRRFYGLRGNMHMHTCLSDGTKTHEELAHIAGEAGLDFIIVTDHNTYRPGYEGWVGDTLVLVGEEVHDPNRELQSSHTLCFNIQEDVSGYRTAPQALMDAVAAQGQLAHTLAQLGSEDLMPPDGVEDEEIALAYSRLSRAILWVHNQCRRCPERDELTCRVASNWPERPAPLLDVASEIANTGRIVGCINA